MLNEYWRVDIALLRFYYIYHITIIYTNITNTFLLKYAEH